MNDNLSQNVPLHVDIPLEGIESEREEEIQKLNKYFSDVLDSDEVKLIGMFCCFPCICILIIWAIIEEIIKELYSLFKNICIFFKNLYLLIYYTIHVDEGESVLPTYVNEINQQNSIQQNQH